MMQCDCGCSKPLPDEGLDFCGKFENFEDNFSQKIPNNVSYKVFSWEPIHPTNFLYTSRLKTFLKYIWSSDKPCKYEMAKYGFFAVDEKYAKCYQCGICIGTWKKGDSPYTKHFEFAYQCTFLNSCQPPEQVTKL